MNYKKNEASKVTSANEMTEELLTSRFGSHESVCKPDHQCGMVETEEDAICRESSKITWARKNVYKVGVKGLRRGFYKLGIGLGAALGCRCDGSR